MGLPGVAEGVAGNLIYGGGSNWVRRLFGTQIRIVSPRAGSYLEDNPQPCGDMTTYKVQGTLKRLPKGHEIWLLRQDEFSSKLWPQGFFRAVFDPETKQWHGRVNGTGQPSFRVIAVVAPPTSHDFFTFFQRVGDKTGHYEPIDRVPPECRNLRYVQVRVR